MNGLEELNEHVSRRVKEEQIAVILFQPGYAISPYLLFDLKIKYGLSLVSMCFDDEYLFELISSVYVRICDLVFTHDVVAVQRYRMAGIDAEWVMLAGQPPVSVPQENKHWKRKVSFVGTISEEKPDRERFINYLKDHNLEVEVSGNANSESNLYLSIGEMQDIFQTSQISLNFSGISLFNNRFSHPLGNQIRGAKARPFEIALAGGFCLSEHSVTLASVFRDGVDMAFFYNKDELVKKIQFYLGHPELCISIAQAGRKKAIEVTDPINVIERLKSLPGTYSFQRSENLYGEKLGVEIPSYFRTDFIKYVFTHTLKRFIKTRKWMEFYCSWRVLNNFLIRSGVRFPQGMLLLVLCGYCLERGLLKNNG